MKDLATYHLANTAVLEEVLNVGSEYKLFEFPYRVETGSVVTPGSPPTTIPSPYAGQIVFDLAEDCVSESANVVLGGLTLRPYQIEGGIPAFYYRFSAGTGPDGVDQIEISEPLDQDLVIKISSLTQYLTDVIELRGSGFRYATEITVGRERIGGLTRVSDSIMQFKLSKDKSAAAIIQNIKVLISLDKTPQATEIIFDISTRARAATGPQLVLQRFLTLLLDPAAGNLDGMIPKGVHVTPQFRAAVINRITLAVRVTRVRMRSTAAANAPSDELLSSAALQNIKVDEATGVVDASIRLITQSGKAITSPLSLGG